MIISHVSFVNIHRHGIELLPTNIYIYIYVHQCHVRDDKYDRQRTEEKMRLPTELIVDAHLGTHLLNKFIKTAFFFLLLLLFCYLTNANMECILGILLLHI